MTDREALLAAKLDPGIAEAVLALRREGVETFESCEGGKGHAYPEPTIRFHGTSSAGWHALSVALTHRLPVLAVARVWDMEGSEPAGPYWELRLRLTSPSSCNCRTEAKRSSPIGNSGEEFADR